MAKKQLTYHEKEAWKIFKWYKYWIEEEKKEIKGWIEEKLR